MISQYWINQIPARPITIQVKNEQGQDMDLSIYTQISVKMVGTNNELVNLSGSIVNDSSKATGKIIFTFPSDRSLFKKTGEYALQVELKGSDKLDFTTTHTIRVRELGRTIR